MILRRLLHFFAACSLLASINLPADTLNLPKLGDSTSSIISQKQEAELGQYWLRAFRQQTALAEDPLLYTYLYHLIQRMALYSPLEQKSFDLAVIDNKAFNAFAVPGNVIGINTGLFLHATTEDELASVITHELGHLSQRHYARTVEQQKHRGVATLAGLLGSLLIMAAGGGDAGLAAMTATQAAAMDNQLKYSRIHEQEADRIGIQTLAAAGMNPRAAAEMFQHILAETRYRSDLKEFAFLMTHPLPDSRVTDALNQAQQYQARGDVDSLAFHLMKSRVYLMYANTADDAVKHFQRLQQSGDHPQAADYGLALALLEANRPDEAEELVDQLYSNAPQQIAFQLARIRLLEKQQKIDEAISLSDQLLALSPGNYPLSMQAARLYQKYHHIDSAVKTMRKLINSGWPDTPDVWYQMAELEGLAGNIVNVHLARAEYYIRVGAFDEAIRHLNLAKPLVAGNMQALSRIDIRLQNAQALKQNSPF